MENCYKFIYKLVIGNILLLNTFCFGQTPLGIQSSQQLICAGSNVTLYAIGSGSARSWSPGGQTSQTITVSPSFTTTYTLNSGGNTTTYTVYVCDDADCQATSSFSPLLFNTGNNGLSGIKTIGQADNNWQISTNENGPFTPAIVSDNSVIPGNYSKSSWPNTQWIGPNANLRSSRGDYYFRVQFMLTEAELQDLVLNMQFMADNTVMGVYVNGILVPNSSTPGLASYGFQMQNASSAKMEGNWVEGLNSILVKVYDEGGYTGFLGQLNPILKIPTQKIPGCAIPLPIRFTSFSVKSSETQVYFKWNGEAKDVAYFTIEESGSGEHFTSIGTVSAGNNKIGSWTFHSKKANNAITYYRIVAHDIDGSLSFSDIRTINNENLVVTISPNPGSGIFNLSGKSSGIESNTITITNCEGKEVIREHIALEEENFNLTLDLTHLNPGVYFLRYSSLDGQVVKKLIKD